MTWTGQWKNQYGSILTIVEDHRDTISGTFRTALQDSSFYGQELPVSGIHRGNCISFSFAGTSANGDAIASFTGLLRENGIETLWFVLSDGVREGDRIVQRAWPHAALTNHDIFVRVALSQ